MARPKNVNTNPEDTNNLNCKVNDRTFQTLKLLSIVTKTPVSVLVVHAVGAYITVQMEKHAKEIAAFFGGTAATVMAEPAPVETAQAAE